MKMDETQAIKLFVSFYKLLFLGTEFSSKMLKIKIIEKKSSLDSNSIIIDNDGMKTDEESKMSDNNFIYDTSDIITSDIQVNEN